MQSRFRNGRDVHGRLVFAAGAALGVLGTFNSVDAQTKYAVVDLNAGGSESQAEAINSLGAVVGYFSNGSVDEAFIWDGGVSTRIENTLGGVEAKAYDLNDLGQVVGFALDGFGSSRAFVYLPEDAYGLSAGLNDLGTLRKDDAGTAVARDIHNSGRIVGRMDTGAGANQVPNSFLWFQGTKVQLLGLDPFGYGVGHAVNSEGTVVGGAQTNQIGPLHAVVWYDLLPASNLGTLGGSTSLATDINDYDVVVGYAYDIQERQRATLWLLEDQGGFEAGAYDLGTLGGEESSARAINNLNQVVGFANTPSGSKHACLWEAGVPSDLNDLILDSEEWLLMTARDINDSGQIVGTALRNGNRQAVLLNPCEFDLEVSPLIGGQPGTFTITCGKANTRSFLAYSTIGIGSTFVPRLNVTLDLSFPETAGPAQFTDANGEATWTLTMPNVVTPTDIWWQAVQLENKTDVVAAVVQP